MYETSSSKGLRGCCYLVTFFSLFSYIYNYHTYLYIINLIKKVTK
nr:MAG TPA: hypothetical protein [Caudoviricetes sp.]